MFMSKFVFVCPRFEVYMLKHVIVCQADAETKKRVKEEMKVFFPCSIMYVIDLLYS